MMIDIILRIAVVILFVISLYGAYLMVMDSEQRFKERKQLRELKDAGSITESEIPAQTIDEQMEIAHKISTK